MYTVKFENINLETGGFGSKVNNLVKLLKSGFAVPPGFLVTAESFEKFLRASNLHEKVSSLMESFHENERAAADVKNLILGGDFPDFLTREIKTELEELSLGRDIQGIGGVALDLVKAGRGDSVVALRPAMQGRGRSFLNIRGSVQLFENLKHCWASMIDSHPKIGEMNVIIQKMVNAEKSGIVSSSDPVRKENRMILEGIWGLGETIEEDIASPDFYLIDKNSGEVVVKEIGNKSWQKTRDAMSEKTVTEHVPADKATVQVFHPPELNTILELSKKVEQLFPAPQKIKFSVERNKLYILDTSHMKVKESASFSPEEVENKKLLVTGRGVAPGVVKGRVRVIVDMSELQSIQEGDILVSKSLPYHTFSSDIRGIITESGSFTGKSGEKAREMGIPYISGVSFPFQDNKEIIMDAYTGNIYELEEVQSIPQAPVEDDIVATHIKLSLSFPHVPDGLAEKTDGVGIIKAEHILTEGGRHPLHRARENPEELVQILVSKLGALARKLHPKPVWYRSLDARTDEFKSLGEEIKEANPLLGWHGIRRSLDEDMVLRCEIEALKRLYSEGMNNIYLMLPFVSVPEEVRKVKSWLDFPLKLGIVIEIPSAAMRIEEFCREGISSVILNHDTLYQLMTGIDLSNPKISGMYREEERTVLELIHHVIKGCRNFRIETSIFGDICNNSRVVEQLVEMGISSITTEGDTFDIIKNIVARTERKLLLEKAREE
jgi:pyruvate,water dikinase